MMNVGSFRDSITIQEYKSIINNNGFEEKKWITLHVKRSQVKAPSLRKQELFKGQGFEINNLMEFTTRYFENLKYEYRILWDGKTWDIKGIENPDGLKRYYRILCENTDN